jgi:hypothetical protein
MWTIIICGAIAIIVSSIIYYREVGIEYIDFFSAILVEIMFGLIGALIGILIAVIIPGKMIEQKETVQIIAIQDNITMNGSFFLGSGQVDGEMKYMYYYKSDSNTYKFGDIDADICSISYDSINPRIVFTYKIKDENAIINIFSINNKYYLDKAIIYIPEGSLVSNYNLDLKN